MTKKLLSLFLTLTVLSLPSAPCLARTGPQTQQEQERQRRKEEERGGKEEEKRRKEEEKRNREAEGKKGGGIFGTVKGAAKRAGKMTVDVATGKAKGDPVALTLGALFNDQLPLKLDASKVYKDAPPPENFRPVALKLTIKNVDTPLPPGDYTMPIHAICTKDSVHVPGRGVGYKLAPLQGKQADALAALILRGDVARVSHPTLQMIAWEIQASIPYDEMPPEHQALVDKLIPEYKKEIRGGFLQRVEARYQQFVGKNSKILPLDDLLEQAGVGNTLRSLRRSRQIIREESFNYQRSQMRLYDGPPGERVITPDTPETSPWTEVLPGVFTQVVIREGWQGVNDLNLRITPQARASVPAHRPPFLKAGYGQAGPGVISPARLFGFAVTALTAAEAAPLLATPQGLAAAGLTILVIGGIYYLISDRNTRPALPALNPPAAYPPPAVYPPLAPPSITYPVNHATQALIPSLMVGPESGGGGGSKDKKPKMLGEKGTKTPSKTLWQDGKARIDVENPNPGQRPGQIHYQDGAGRKYLYDPTTKAFRGAPNSVNRMLENPRVQAAIRQGMRVLGEIP